MPHRHSMIVACIGWCGLLVAFLVGAGCASTDSNDPAVKQDSKAPGTGDTAGHNVYSVPVSREGLKRSR